MGPRAIKENVYSSATDCSTLSFCSQLILSLNEESKHFLPPGLNPRTQQFPLAAWDDPSRMNMSFGEISESRSIHLINVWRGFFFFFLQLLKYNPAILVISVFISIM